MEEHAITQLFVTIREVRDNPTYIAKWPAASGV
jgi:hypothetical protein